MENDILRRFHAAMPGIQSWIDELLDQHAPYARRVSTLGLARLRNRFPESLLERAKTVTVSRVPFPPVERFDLPELEFFRQASLAGITFKDTYFIQNGQTSEALHFHELVHIVQWERLGPDNFLLAYGIGLVQFGYRWSPLEEMAYSLERSFEAGRLPQDLLETIRKETDEIWARIAPAVP